MKALFKNLPARDLMALVLLVFAVGFNFIFLAPELSVVADLNDNVFAFSLVQRMSNQLQATSYQLPAILDHWVSTWAMGYPLPYYYQHIPHLAVVLLTKLFTPLMKIPNYKFQITNFFVFHFIQYLLLSAFPLVIYCSSRKFKLSKMASAFAALCSCLISTNFLYGLEYGSYVWRGSGMYTQLWGMFFLPLALSHIFVTITEGKGLVSSILLLAATFASHTVFGLIAMVSGGLMWVREFRGFGKFRESGRLLLVFAFSFLILSYWLVPLVLGSQYHNRSFWDDPWKWDAFGFRETVAKFLNGELLDYGRAPILTLLTLLGFFVALHNFGNLGFFALSFIVWFLGLFGRPAFGPLLDRLPMVKELHLHRLIAGFHLASIYLAGIGLASLTDLIVQLTKRSTIVSKSVRSVGEGKLKFATTMGVLALLLLPLFRERYQFLELNRQWIAENNISYQKDEQDFEKILEKLQTLPYGRVYAGRAGNWGKDFKVGMVQVYMVLNNNGFDTVGWLPETWSLNGDLEQFFDETRHEHYDLFNIKYIVADGQQTFPEFAKLIQSSGKYQLYEVPTSGNFAFVTSPLQVLADKNSVFNLLHLWMTSDRVKKALHPTITYGDKVQSPKSKVQIEMRDLKSYEENEEIHSLWEKNPFAEILDTRYQIPDTAKILEDIKEPNSFKARVEVSEPTILMLKASYHPQWQAFVDGEKKETLMLAPSYVGVEIDEGTHQIEFRYESNPLKKTLMVISLVGLVGLLSLTLLRNHIRSFA